MAAFELDERKLRRAMPVQVSTTGEDLKMVGFVIAGPILLLGSVALLIYSLISLL